MSSKTYMDTGEARVSHEGGFKAGASQFNVDGCGEADDGDDIEIAEHLCRGAQGLIIP
jgi:hypothetical protein